MQEGWSCIKEPQDFFKKVHSMGKIPQDSILVTADLVGFDLSIPHNVGLEALKDGLNCKQNKKIPTDFLEWPNLFSLISTLSLDKRYSIKFLEQLLAQNMHHLMRTLIWISLRKIVLKRRNCSHFFGLGIYDVFFILTHSKEELKSSMK